MITGCAYSSASPVWLPHSAIALRYLGHPTPGTAAATEAQLLRQRDLAREALIAYRGPPKTIKTVSYYQALNYERMLPPGIFAGKIVLVCLPRNSTCRSLYCLSSISQ